MDLLGRGTSGEQSVEDGPLPGSTVSLLSVTGDIAGLSELSSWSPGPTGATATATALLTTTAETVELLNGARVWASLFTGVTDTLLVVQGVVHRSPSGSPTELVLTDITGIAEESRRIEPRAPLSRPARLRIEPSHPPVAGQTVDLSPSGCRLALSSLEHVAVDDVVTVEVDLDERILLRAAAEVRRVDEQRQESVLRFLGLPPSDAVDLHRCVYSALRSGTRAEGVGSDPPSQRV